MLFTGMLRSRRVAAALTALLSMVLATAIAGAASASPLGLSNGDVVTSLEWAADGDYAQGSGALTAAGDIESVTISGGGTNPLAGVDFEFAAAFSFDTILPLGGPFFLVLGDFVSTGGTDITVTQGGDVILEAMFTSNLQVGGVLDISNLPAGVQVSVNASNIAITGGDPDLVAALGGLATLELTGTISNFSPSLAVLIGGDQNPWNDDFSFSGGGTLNPQSPAPFVPEPSTALLLGLGLAGLGLAGARRRL